VIDISVIEKLLSLRADKELGDLSGMTAFGVYGATVAGYEHMDVSMIGMVIRSQGTRAILQAIQKKPRPTLVPSVADLCGGKGAGGGFMRYDNDGSNGGSY